MRRGFLNTPRRSQNSAPGPSPRASISSASPPPSRGTRDAGEPGTADGNAMDVDVPNRQGPRPSCGAKPKPEPPLDPAGKGKGKEPVNKTATSTEHTLHLPPRPSPRRPGWGHDPAEDILHTVPRSHGGPHRKRAVFRQWPRDPNGKPLLPSDAPRGTLSPDGYPWGATLYDFYNVLRVPGMPFAMTVMTGSALVEAMRELGEGVAVDELKWAEDEGEPRDEGVADTVQLIESVERRVQLGTYSKYSMREDLRKTGSPIWDDDDEEEEEEEEEVVVEEEVEVEVEVEEEDGGGWAGEDEDQEESRDEGHPMEDIVEGMPECPEEGHDEKYDKESVRTTPECDGEVARNGEDHDKEMKPAPEDHQKEEDKAKVKVDSDIPAYIPPPTIPVTSPFHLSHYPEPWPLIPFKNPLSILLQERIPLYLLPQKMYVHDPFGLLPACERRFCVTSWMSRPDVVRTYNLSISKSVHREVEKARQKAEALEEFKSRTLVVLRYKRSKEQIKNHQPAIEVPLPPYPRRVTNVEESHLYLSPVAQVGQGHHSIVYKAEWELPRDLFVRPKLCGQCFKKAADEEIQRLKRTGRWERMLKAVAWGPTGPTGHVSTQQELDEASDATSLQRDGEIIEREIICIVPHDFVSQAQLLGMFDRANIWETFMKQKDATVMHLDFSEDDQEGQESPRVVTIRIDPPFSYESQKICSHGLRPFPVPRTVKFTVVAKLSLQYDQHLVREAHNYQSFPEHFFHHYNGYTLIGQLRSIVPVHAVVPQFYGYYVPDDGEQHRTREGYLSPILLLEHCGEPIDPEKLSEEDQDECASLLLRFQRAGWLHDSVAPRNVLVQQGKPTEFPLEREANPEPSFRLIDFGRSRKDDGVGKHEEEHEILRMFEGLKVKMSVTLR